MSSKRSLSTPSSSSVAIIEGNDDLLIEILLFLAAKSLVRFKLVSKRWRSLISVRSFCCRHTLHHPLRRPESQTLFILSGHKSNYYVCKPTVPKLFPSQFRLDFSLVEILRSCNGLLLLRCRKSEYGNTHYRVFNPTTMQQRDLSPLPCSSVSGIYLMFDPSLSLHYKVVCFVHTKRYTLVYLYDSETHKWKLGAERIANMRLYDGIYFNGCIYFLRFDSSSSRFTPDEKLSKIPSLPRGRRGSRQMHYTAMGSNGVLLLFAKQESNLLDVYETKEIENGWSKIYQVDLNPILGNFKYFRLLGMIRGEGGGEEEDSSLMFVVPGKLMIYRFYDAVFEVVDDDFSMFSERKGCSFGSENAHNFIPSLAPV